MTKNLPLCAALTLLALLFLTGEAIRAPITPWNGRSLLSIFDAIHGGCPQGPPETVTEETMLNHHDYWEQNGRGRTGVSWPRRGFQECWANRGSVCALPDRDNTVCLPGSRRGSTIAQGWALDPKSQACKPGVHCLYACEPGYYWTTYNQAETSNYDYENAHQRGHCDGTWNYGTSTHGVYCKEDGTLDLPSDKPLCALGETYVYAENRLDTHVFLCQTVFPGHEIFLIPTLVPPGQSVMLTTQPVDFWHGPTYSKPTHGDFYVSFAGADIMEACTWDEFSPSGAALLPYEIGSGVEDNGVVYSTHYFYQQPNSEVPERFVGYQMDLECESSEKGVCGPVFRNNNVVKADVLRKPTRQGSTKVKFIFRKPQAKTEFGDMYREPSRNHLHDLSWITAFNGGAPVSVPQKRSSSSSSSSSSHSYAHEPSYAHSSSSASGHSASASSTAVAGSSSSSGGYYQGGNEGSSPGYSPGGHYSSPSFRPDFTSGEHHYPSPHTSYPGSHHGRLLKTFRKKSDVYLHNTLATPIVICSSDPSRSGERGSVVGPGEKIQLEAMTSLKISTKTTKNSGTCSQETEFQWLITTGERSSKEINYSYMHLENNPGYQLALRCVSEDESCTPTSARSVAVLPSEVATTPVVVTFVVKPSSASPHSTSSTTYAWAQVLPNIAMNLFRFPSS